MSCCRQNLKAWQTPVFVKDDGEMSMRGQKQRWVSKKHEECLKQCEIKCDACELEQEIDKSCDIEMSTCERGCDFDYGP
jgi:hypothetical protein